MQLPSRGHVMRPCQAKPGRRSSGWRTLGMGWEGGWPYIADLWEGAAAEDPAWAISCDQLGSDYGRMAGMGWGGVGWEHCCCCCGHCCCCCGHCCCCCCCCPLPRQPLAAAPTRRQPRDGHVQHRPGQQAMGAAALPLLEQEVGQGGCCGVCAQPACWVARHALHRSQSQTPMLF